MLKRLLVPTLVLTLAGFIGAGAGCHDSSGNGTNHPTGAAGSTGGDGAAGVDGSASDTVDAPAGDTATEGGATEAGSDTATDHGATEAGGDTAADHGATEAGGDVSLDLGLDHGLDAIGN